MATDYPEVIGEYIDAPKRFEVDGLQYVAVFEPDRVAQGEPTRLVLYLQNMLNVPLTVQIKLGLPQVGRFRSQPIFTITESEIDVTLSEAEVGTMIVPVIQTEQITSGEHEFNLEFKVQHSKTMQVVRHPRPKNPLSAVPIESPIGLRLVGVTGISYQVVNGKKLKLPLTVSEAFAEEVTDADLKPVYHKLWDLDMVQSQHDAQVLINTHRAEIIDDLEIEPLFVALLSETQHRFADSGLPLRVGEAIALGKLLVFTVHLFLSTPELQDGLLCPIWERAAANKFPTANVKQAMRIVGYRHLLRLSLALSFGMTRQAIGSLPWSLDEQQGVIDYISEALEDGTSLDEDFLYLPLMMGATRVVGQVRLPDEELAQTLHLIKLAHKARTDLFADEELQEAGKIYNALLKKM